MPRVDEQLLQRYVERYELEAMLSELEHHRVKELFKAADNVTNSLGFNEHGEEHARVVAANSLRILDLFYKAKIVPSFVESYKGSIRDSAVIVFLAGYLHDIGVAVHKDKHHMHSVPLAIPIVERCLSHAGYAGPKFVQMKAAVLQAIYAHESHVEHPSLESSIICLADGTDITKDRIMRMFDKSGEKLHPVTGKSIDKVAIERGVDKPVIIEVRLNHRSGLALIDDMLGRKLEGSGIKQYVKVMARVKEAGKEKALRVLR